MSNHDDEVIDLNAGDETLDNNEFEINLEIPKADSKKRKLSETIENGERDTSEIEHVRKSPKNNLDQANEWFTSFFNATDDSSSQPERNTTANTNTNSNSKNNSSSTNNSSTSSTVTAESPRISTKHLANPVPPKTNVNTAPTTPASAKNTTPTSIAKQPTPAPIKIAVQPTVLPPNVSTTSVPLPATVVARVPSNPKQNYRFAITQQGIVMPVVNATTPTILGGRPAPQIAPKAPLVQPVQKPASQPTNTTSTNTANTATPAIAKADPKVGGLVFRLQDTVTALAVVQKALEQKKASLIPTSISTLTAIAPKPSTTTTATPAPPKASTTPTATSTPAVRVPLHIPKQTATYVPPKQTTTTTSSNTTPSIRTSTNGSTASTSAPQARPNMPSPTILRRSGTGQAPTQRVSPQTTPAQSPQSVPRAVSSQPQTTQISHPMPSRPTSSQTTQTVPTRASPSPQPQARATTSLPPSPSVSPSLHPVAVPQRTVTPPQRNITPPQQPSVPHAIPVASYNNQYNAQPAQPTGTYPYYNYQEQYQRLMRQYPNQYTTSSQPSLSTTAQPTYNTGQTQQQYSSSQPNPQAQYSHLYQTQAASYSHSNQAQYSAQSASNQSHYSAQSATSPHQAQYATQPVPAQYSHSHEQYSAQHTLQPQYTYSSQPNAQLSHTASQPSSLRVSVNPTQGTAALRTSQSQYPPHTVEVPSTEQSSYISSFGPAYQQQQPYQYQAYAHVSDGDYMPLDLTNNIEAYNTGLVSSQYTSQSMSADGTYSAVSYDSGQMQQYNQPVQTTHSQQGGTATSTTSASTTNTAQVAQIPSTLEQPKSNVNTPQQVLPQPTTTQPQATNSAKEVDSNIATTTVDTAKPASPPELISNSKSASQDDVIFVGTNRKPEKPMRRSVALPPRRLVPSSASNQTSTPTNNTSTSNTEKNTNTSTNTDTTLALIAKSLEAPATSNNIVAEPMQVDSDDQPNTNQQQVESSTATTTEPRPELNNESDNSSQVNSNADRDRCMLISTARFLRRSGEVNDSNNGGTQNNNPMYIDVPDADQSEVNRLKPNTRHRRQIYRTDEYWSYWSAASQSQQSQEYGQDEQSNRSSERDINSPAHSPGDLGQLTQQYNEPQTAPEIQIERQQGQVVAQQTSKNNNNLAKSSEFGLTNFEIDEESYMPTTSPPVPRLRALPNNNNNVDSTVPSTSPRQHVQPNPGGFSTNASEGNIHSVSSNSTSPRIIGPLDRYFRVSPEKVQNAPTTTAAVQQQQNTTVPSYTNERDVIMINDSQEDRAARENNNNFSHNTNQWNNNYYASQDNVPAANTHQTNAVVNNNNYSNNVANNTSANQQQVFLASRSRTPDNLRQSNNAEKKASDGSKAQQKVLLPYVADGPLVLTRIEPPPAWHGGLLWPGLGTIKQQYMELFIPNDPRIQAIPYITELPKLLMAREMSICDSQTMPTGHFCIQLISPVLDKHSLPKAFWDPNYKAFWALKMHYNNLLLCVGPKMLERKTILCLYITVQGPTPRPITCTLSNVPADMLNFFQGLNLEHYYHEFLRNGITSLYALCQITREQMVTIITNETELNVVLNELRKLVMETASNNTNNNNNNNSA